MRIGRCAVVALAVVIVFGGVGWMLGSMFGIAGIVLASLVAWAGGTLVGVLTFDWCWPGVRP